MLGEPTRWHRPVASRPGAYQERGEGGARVGRLRERAGHKPLESAGTAAQLGYARTSDLVTWYPVAPNATLSCWAWAANAAACWAASAWLKKAATGQSLRP